MKFLEAGGFLGIIAPLPVQVRDFVQRPDFSFRITMAIQTESHAKRLKMIDFIHFIDRPVALHTTDPPVHVDRVVEINEVRNPMDLDPGYWPAALFAFAHER
jgi:hypothetical protein